jgi:superfamily II DNA or RNA helicase
VTFAVGSLVKARGREWVVLPESEGDLLVLRPLGGRDDEKAGVFVPLEPVEPASFDLPNPDRLGDFRSSRLLREAVRLGFRASAGPFRSFGSIAVEPRPYQLVPLLLALRLDPVRLLIADDVGIGKTIEAFLIARELLDRGEIERFCVLCLPHLAEQLQREMSLKFHIEAELILSSTAGRLERGLRPGESLFDRHPFTVVSMDFVKSDRRREEFLRACPEFVIVDEAHACTEVGRSAQERHRLLADLAKNPARHLLLVTATPHSGSEEAFRSLLGLLRPEFLRLPADLAGSENEPQRRTLAAHFVQRRRADIEHYLNADTPFPKREEAETTYRLSPEYRTLLQNALDWARETVQSKTGTRFQQRIRWWATLGMLRCLASSPAAGADTLRRRAGVAATSSEEEADDLGRRSVMDQIESDSAEVFDVVPGSDSEEPGDVGAPARRRLREMAKLADSLRGEKDAKLLGLLPIVRKLLDDGFSPIVFCRFIETSDYIAEELRKRLKGVEIASVTGRLPHEDREKRILDLAKAGKHVLVCTDCLSEGINLQEHFDAVLHYDLSWNPTRHEQREGRVDRFGQPKKTVRVTTYYGADNPVDGIVLRVLLEKHKKIRNSLGISVPVPVDTEKVVEAIFEAILLKGSGADAAAQLALFEDLVNPEKQKLEAEWDAAASREKRSRTLFAQHAIKVEDVGRELAETREALGTGSDLKSFVFDAVAALGGRISGSEKVEIDLSEAPRAVRDAVGGTTMMRGRFELPVAEGETHLSRTSPLVEGLATHLMDTALDASASAVAARCGVIRTKKVATRTTLLLLRYRFHLVVRRGKTDRELLAEDSDLLAFEGAPESPRWLAADQARDLLGAAPDANVSPDVAQAAVEKVVAGINALRPQIEETAKLRSERLLEAHRRVREAARGASAALRVEVQGPPDVVGIYVFLPAVPPT